MSLLCSPRHDAGDLCPEGRGAAFPISIKDLGETKALPGFGLCGVYHSMKQPPGAGGMVPQSSVELDDVTVAQGHAAIHARRQIEIVGGDQGRQA